MLRPPLRRDWDAGPGSLPAAPSPRALRPISCREGRSGTKRSTRDATWAVQGWGLAHQGPAHARILLDQSGLTLGPGGGTNIKSGISCPSPARAVPKAGSAREGGGRPSCSRCPEASAWPRLDLLWHQLSRCPPPLRWGLGECRRRSRVCASPLKGASRLLLLAQDRMVLGWDPPSSGTSPPRCPTGFSTVPGFKASPCGSPRSHWCHVASSLAP